MLKLRLDPDYLFRSLPREEFEKLALITEQEIQEALDRGRPRERVNPAMLDTGMFYY